MINDMQPQQTEATQTDGEITYEAAVAELERIVSRLESGETPLDQSLALFQRGSELARICAGRLDEIERKITQLIEQPDGSVREEPFGDAG